MQVSIRNTILTLLLVVHVSYAYKHFHQKIPNGASVPHPCISGRIWEGVGHKNPLGGGALTPFGEDFLNNGKVWNGVLCMMDSDRDGRTNGEELGDPSCVWSEGQLPSVVEGLSHPGVCDPVTDVNTCDSTPEWLSCENKYDTFECPAFNEPETIKLPVRFPRTTVPPREDTFKCMFFEIPLEEKHHIVGETLISDNAAALHHILLFRCNAGFIPDIPTGTLYDCAMAVTDSCNAIFASSKFNAPDRCWPSETGMLIGGKHGRYIVAQIHWYNPELCTDMTDSSGIMLFLKPKLRAYNTGVLLTGEFKLDIPPGRESTVRQGQCTSACTSRFIVDYMNIFSVHAHMHLIGKSQTIELQREGGEIQTLGDEQNYDFNNPSFYMLTTPVMFKPGDALLTTCNYNSTSRTEITEFGDSSADEMCLNFVYYYPEERLVLPDPYCATYGDIDTCDGYTGYVGECKIYKWSIPRNPDTLLVYRNAEEKCDTTRCLEECKAYVKGLRSRDPCYQGEVYAMIRTFKKTGYGAIADENEDWDLFFSLLESCEEELAEDGWNVGGEMGGANYSEGVSSMFACIVVGLLSNYLL